MERAQREQLHNVVFCDPVNKTRLAGLMAATDVGLQLLANVLPSTTAPRRTSSSTTSPSGVPPPINYPGWLAELVNEHHSGSFAVPPDDPAASPMRWRAAAADRAELPRMARAREAGAGSV